MVQSPLHVAVDWLWATVLVLASGADPYQVDFSDCTTIDNARWLRGYKVVRILLGAGSPLLADGALRDVVACCPINYCEQLLKLVISHLAIRRWELLQIAPSLLPEATLSSIVPPNEVVPDTSPYQLVEAVCAAGNTTKPEYWLQATAGLYKSYGMFPAAPGVLYGAAFNYLDGRDNVGETSLTCARTSAITAWLYQRGASFTEHHVYSATSMPSMYWAILGLAYSIYIDEEASNTYDKLSLRRLSEDEYSYRTTSQNVGIYVIAPAARGVVVLKSLFSERF